MVSTLCQQDSYISALPEEGRSCEIWGLVEQQCLCCSFYFCCQSHARTRVIEKQQNKNRLVVYLNRARAALLFNFGDIWVHIEQQVSFQCLIFAGKWSVHWTKLMQPCQPTHFYSSPFDSRKFWNHTGKMGKSPKERYFLKTTHPCNYQWRTPTLRSQAVAQPTDARKLHQIRCRTTYA